MKEEASVEVDEIEEVEEAEEVEEEQPPKKKRRTSNRTARASIETLADEDPSTSKKKGKRTRSAKGRKSVFRSRDGAENSEPIKEESWEAGSKKISLTDKSISPRKESLARCLAVVHVRVRSDTNAEGP